MRKIQKLTPFLLALLSFFACKKNEVTSVVLSDSEKILSIGETWQLKLSFEATTDESEFSAVWSSDNEAVASVTSDGLVTALTSGETDITVSLGGMEAQCRIFVMHYSKAKQKFERDPYSTGKSNLTTLYLATREIDLDHMTGDGEYLSIELYTDIGIVDSLLPAGTYTMVADFVPGDEIEYDKFLPHTLSPGFTEYGSRWGTWCYILSSGTASAYPLLSGKVEVDKSTDELYTISYNLYDKQGKHFSGNYEGKIALQHDLGL